MPIRLPDYSDESLEAFTVCARVIGGTNALPDIEDAFESRIVDGGNIYWLRTILDTQDDPPGIHIHVDSLRETLFDEANIPSTSKPLDEALSCFDNFFGEELVAKPRARFSIPLENLPDHNPISLLLQVSAGEGDSLIRLTGAMFEIGEENVDRFEWRVEKRDGREYAVATVSSKVTIKLGETFLADSLSPLNDALRLFLRHPQHADEGSKPCR